MGINTVIIASEDFSTIRHLTVGERVPTHGISSCKIVLGTGDAHGGNKVRGDRGKGGDHHDGLHNRGGGHYGGVEHGGEEVRDKNHLILHNQSMKCYISR